MCSDPMSGLTQMVGTRRWNKVGQLALTRDDKSSPNDEVDDNISQHVCKTPDQFPFLGPYEASKVLGP